eukprot:CAMPEP_0114570478 /NCGR_PEP_ID=MMETSP0114-20121206/17221_1 /TAXON_ID=31324 /ORGANISM="Goniomonas sp, Strain m" /LENGTH=81 /DNA_ID=CAMNT_0001757507 /DNA_START=170 /DNA_END=415 /DNA_ORIENTATION=-
MTVLTGLEAVESMEEGTEASGSHTDREDEDTPEATETTDVALLCPPWAMLVSSTCASAVATRLVWCIRAAVTFSTISDASA